MDDAIVVGGFLFRHKGSPEDALRELEELLREARAAQESREEKDLSPEAFAFYWLLNREGVADAEKAGREAAAFERYPYWQTSPDQERQVRRLLFKALLRAYLTNFAVDPPRHKTMN